ncbi:ornithine cyclodeaminase/alanine dehydrogenase-like protein (mu-crystallin family) [Lachnospiraceae bacterium PF1-21]|nr:ornithine cyclodeaminase [Lachnospiraceae bacterium OttesenSCG-928-J05]
MKIVTFDDIIKLNIDPVTCFQWVEETIKNKEKATLPPKISLQPKEGVFCNVMPCFLNSSWGGVKVVNRYPERKPSLDSKILLLNMESGEFLALMDGNWITAMRTGAVAAHSILKLARREFSTIAMLGLGNTARATLLVLASLIGDKKIHVKLLKYKEQEKAFVERFANHPNLEFSYIETQEEVIKGSEVVVSCVTHFQKDICSDDCFDEGVLVVPVHTRGFTNCDLFFDKVYADDYGHVHHFQNFEKFKYFAEIQELVKGRARGRESDTERILAYNIGLAIHDINYAAHIYQMIIQEGNIMNLNLGEPIEKFWI